jgi:predicted RNA-binding Zn ribbon-like protein
MGSTSYDPDAWLPIGTEEVMLECQNALRPLIDSWIDAGGDIYRWARRPNLEKALKRSTFAFYRTPDGRPSFRLGMPHATVSEGEAWAAEYMFKFITSPLYDRVARCANEKCGSYYLKDRGNRRFCSGKKCGKNFHALMQTERARMEERTDKIERVHEAIREFQRLSPKKSAKLDSEQKLKTWLAKAAGPDLTPNFITAASRKGEIPTMAELLGAVG